MVHTIIVLVILAIVAYFVFARLKSRPKPESSGHSLFLCIPLAESSVIDPDEFARGFEKQWGHKVACSEYEDGKGPKAGQRSYLVGTPSDSMLITVSTTPLPDELLNSILQEMPGLDGASMEELKVHKAFFVVRNVLDSRDATGRARFAAMVAIRLLQRKESLGLVNVPATSYRSRTLLDPLIKMRDLGAPWLFVFLVIIHHTQTDGGGWVHTHGMEHFRLPDIETRFPKEEDYDYYHDLISDAAIYMIESGTVFLPGDTAELAGDGVIYAIRQSKETQEHFWGEFGSIELVRNDR